MFFGRRKSSAEAWKEKGKGADLRKTPRMSLKTLITVRTGGGAYGREAHCKLHDLSLGGLAFIAPWQLVPGDLVSLTLPPPEGIFRREKLYPAILDAQICRVVPSQKYTGQFQTGCSFISPDPHAEEIVRLWFESFGESPEK